MTDPAPPPQGVSALACLVAVAEQLARAAGGRRADAAAALSASYPSSKSTAGAPPPAAAADCARCLPGVVFALRALAAARERAAPPSALAAAGVGLGDAGPPGAASALVAAAPAAAAEASLLRLLPSCLGLLRPRPASPPPSPAAPSAAPPVSPTAVRELWDTLLGYVERADASADVPSADTADSGARLRGSAAVRCGLCLPARRHPSALLFSATANGASRVRPMFFLRLAGGGNRGGRGALLPRRRSVLGACAQLALVQRQPVAP